VRWEDEGDFLELAPAPPVLCEEEPARCSAYRYDSSLFAAVDNYHPAPLSPKPCATMTVAVCRFRAGTTIGAAPAMIAEERSRKSSEEKSRS
jgi:hypothetical protein